MATVIPFRSINVPEPVDQKAAYARMLQRVKEVKSDPVKYQELRAQLQGKNSYEECAEVLVEFITDNESLLTALPDYEDERIKAGVTITVATVFIFANSEY